MGADSSWMSAADACRVLRIAPATLYAYVSRALVRSEAEGGSSRRRRYSRDDVDRLRRRKEGRRNPDAAAAAALRWGLPVLESAITLIADNHLYYRGYDAVHLARTRSVREVASLVWTGQFDSRWRDEPSVAELPRIDPQLSFVARSQIALAAAGAADAAAADLRPASVAAAGWRVLSLLTAVAAPAPARRADAAASPRRRPLAQTLAPTDGADRTIDETLARAWRVPAAGAAAIRAAIVLCADHELNVSSFTARCVASAGSNPYAVVSAGLGALEGSRHGGLSLRSASLLASLRRERNLRSALADRLRRGEPIDGFGHPLYRDGDPRAVALLQLLRRSYPRAPELAFVLEVARDAHGLIGERPTIDFALAALARILRLPEGTPLVLFAIGRTIGWIGHAIEQYATGQIIRPRAKYVGVPHRGAAEPRPRS